MKLGHQKKVREGGTLTSCRAERFGADGRGAGDCGADRDGANFHGTRPRRSGAESDLVTCDWLDVATSAGTDVGTSASSTNSRNMRRKLSESEISSCWRLREMR